MQTSMHDVGEWRNHAHNNCYINTHHDHGIYPSDMSWSLPRPTDYDRNAISPKIRYPPKKLVLNKRDHIRHIYGVDPMLSLKLLHKKESLQTKKMKEMRAKLMSDVLKQFTFDQADVAKKHRASRLNNSSPDNKQLRKSLSVPSVLQKRRSTKTSVLAKHTESMHNMGLLMNLDANHHAMQQQDVARDTDDELSNSDEEELEEHESHWVKKFSNTYARNYWRNTKTGQSSWTDPIPGIVERREAKARAEQEEKERVEREAAEEERKKEEALRALTPAAREKEIKRQQKEEAARLREEERQRAEWEMNEKHRRAIEREWAKLAELEHKITKNMMGVKSAKKQAEEMKRLIQE
mmetsp:Transcript_36742/g.72119  ORF Transcript_36742/g.72119 Transcript_36742/m.72119 type:complete len:351 (+) Transcript_36742:24-1076(+)